MKFPEIRVTRKDALAKKVIWDPCDGLPVVDLTGMKVTAIERVIGVQGPPEVKVTFFARLVENEAEEGESRDT